MVFPGTTSIYDAVGSSNRPEWLLKQSNLSQPDLHNQSKGQTTFLMTNVEPRFQPTWRAFAALSHTLVSRRCNSGTSCYERRPTGANIMESSTIGIWASWHHRLKCANDTSRASQLEVKHTLSDSTNVNKRSKNHHPKRFSLNCCFKYNHHLNANIS